MFVLIVGIATNILLLSLLLLLLGEQLLYRFLKFEIHLNFSLIFLCVKKIKLLAVFPSGTRYLFPCPKLQNMLDVSPIVIYNRHNI